jgi:hypothetical protein
MMNNAWSNEEGYWDKLAERCVCVCVCVCVRVCKFQARLLISASEWTEFGGVGVGCGKFRARFLSGEGGGTVLGGVGGGVTPRRAPQCGCYAGPGNRNVWPASNCISVLHQLCPFLAKGHN